MCSCQLFFFTACSFLPCWPLAFPFFFFTAAIKFSLFFLPMELVSFVFLSGSFSIIHVNVDIKIYSKERIGSVVVVFFLSKSQGGHAVYCQNVRVLEMQNFNPSLHEWGGHT